MLNELNAMYYNTKCYSNFLAVLMSPVQEYDIRLLIFSPIKCLTNYCHVAYPYFSSINGQLVFVRCIMFFPKNLIFDTPFLRWLECLFSLGFLF